MTPPATATGTATTARRRRSLSLRGRLLAGLIGLTAVFLVVMGVVSSLVLGHLEQNQFNTNLKLAARQSIGQIIQSTDGFAAAYLSPRTGVTGVLTPNSAAAAEMRDYLGSLGGKSAAQVGDFAARPRALRASRST